VRYADVAAAKASAACCDCNQILTGRNDVVTRSHENLRSTVRATSPGAKPASGGIDAIIQ